MTKLLLEKENNNKRTDKSTIKQELRKKKKKTTTFQGIISRASQNIIIFKYLNVIRLLGN